MDTSKDNSHSCLVGMGDQNQVSASKTFAKMLIPKKITRKPYINSSRNIVLECEQKMKIKKGMNCPGILYGKIRMKSWGKWSVWVERW